MFKRVIWFSAGALLTLPARAAHAEDVSTQPSLVPKAVASATNGGTGTKVHQLSANEKPVSLEEVLSYASERAPRVLVARGGLAGGKAQLEAASPLFPSDPVLSGSVGRRQTSIGAGVDYSVGIQQEVDVSGRRAAALRAARAEIGSREADVMAAEWFVHQQVHAAFHQSLVARERVIAAQRVLRFSERLVLVASQRHAAGETSPLPVRLAEAEFAQARQAVMLASSDYDRIRLELVRIIGWSEPTLPTPVGRLDPPRTPPDLERLLFMAKDQQPALKAARSRLAAAEARRAAADKKAWPNLTVGVGYESEANPGGAPARILGARLSVPLPLWVGSTPDRAFANAEIEQSRADQSALLTTLDAQIVQARERVEAHAQRALVFGTEILPTLETNLELLQKAFELGEIDVLQVLVAQERFLRTQQDALQSFADYYSAWAELEAIVGVELEPPDAHASTTGREVEP